MTSTTRPTVELKGIKVLASMSEETNCYEATLYVDGAKWASVGNAGHGGCDDVRPIAPRTWDDIKALDALITATYDPLPSDFGGEPLKMDLELLCGTIVDEFIIAKEAVRVTKNKIAFFAEPVADGARAPLYTIPTTKHPEAAIRAHVAGKYPKAVILNDLTGADLVAAYRKAA